MTNDPHEQQPALGHNEQLERQYGQMPHCTPQELVALEEVGDQCS